MNILITGGSGMVGRYLQEILPNAIYVGSKDFNLTSYKEASLLITQERPDWIIHLAAKVGGILDNTNKPCSYYEDNILINSNILKVARIAGVKRFTGVLSTCAYPDNLMLNIGGDEQPSHYYPMLESDLHSGPPSPTNFGYGIAKRALATHIDVCNAQYDTKYNYIIPCNLYGFYDNYHPERSHYVAALIRKIYNAEKEIELFGTGSPLRQFMYAGDLAQIIKLMIEGDVTESFNLATPETYSIKEIAEIAIKAIGKEVEIKFNKSYPDGQFRKDVSIDKFRKIFHDFPFTPLDAGIHKTYYYYKSLHA